MFNGSDKIVQIARELRMSHQAVSSIVKSAPKSGRRRKIGPRLERRVCRASRTNPKEYATEICKKFCPTLSPETVRRCLSRNGLGNFCARNKPALTRDHIVKRLQFKKEHAQKPISFWNKILWLDESKNFVHSTA